ncbi:HAD-IIA family hydrolase [Phytomonospora endophytica]|uniref:HAD superfamily hydrolase (TIGR01450 family) n=1 Tax=Phytomonospora endophytica TaxID=714109 RepID=A0A841FRL1_9ACTN|nr:HAD-IIA family hydrolase [Phytomonospora endophytica]MBB6035937.1 HAD superfamily hydrolase (TIGR01450 family) [Phytomonospora endophytica]GIG71065.1 acid sugar phosphatase [Phytomonospora endophytica]
MTGRPTVLRGGPEPLAARFGLLLLDLDGVVYLLDHPIDGVIETLAAHRGEGGQVVFVTNNAARSPETVAGALSGMGVTADPDEVLSSSRTAATVLAERVPQGAEVLVVGAASLADEVRRAGLKPVDGTAGSVAAVVQGYSPDVGWRELAEATVAIRDGALWVATNPDVTLPSKRGPLPGNGALIGVITTALERGPDVIAGKPGPAMFRQGARTAPELSALVVGDRWDTDIEGAVAAGLPSMLVLSGITRPADVLRIPVNARPDYLGRALGDVRVAHAAPTWRDTSVACAGWEARADGDVLRLNGSGDPLDALRALSELAWGTSSWSSVEADGDAAAGALREFAIA